MDFEKIKTDFEKRYERKYEKIYFVGKSITLFSGKGKSISGCISLGEAMAVSSRSDGRITLQCSGSDDISSFNISEIESYKNHRIAPILMNAEKYGIKLGGADLFVFKNSSVTDLFEPLILGTLPAFCKNVPSKERLLPHFENFHQNFVTASGKSGCVTLFDGQRISHLPFFKGKYKMVFSWLGKEETIKKEPLTSYFDEAVLAVKRGDAERFGTLLTCNAHNIIRGNKPKKYNELFDIVCSEKDSIGNGICEDGGIFSFVENGKIDSFVHSVEAGYRKRYGGGPEFYITDFADSGIFYED